MIVINRRKFIRYITILLISSFAFIVFSLYWIVGISPFLKSPSRFQDNQVRGHANWQVRPAHRQKLTKEDVFKALLSPYIQDREFRDAEIDLTKRLNKVSSLCKKYHLGKYKWSNNTNSLHLKEPPTPLFAYYFWNRARHLAWCPVYKAGSTSWLQNMMRLAGYPEETVEYPPKQISVWAREVYGYNYDLNMETLDKSLKLLVVRHPFERLLSAYRDKLANSTAGHEHGTHHFYMKYGRKIVEKFRKDPTIQQIEPTWEEFVRYILKTDLIQYADDHWLPAYYSCTPCMVDYTVIAKTETYFRDQKYVIKKAGLDQILKPRWSHSTADKKREPRDSLRKQYFGQLTKSKIELLYEKYKLDFLLFDYDHKEYIQLAKDYKLIN